MKWTITADKLVQLNRDLLPKLKSAHSVTRGPVTQDEKDAVLKDHKQRKDLLVSKDSDPMIDENFRVYVNNDALVEDLKSNFNPWIKHSWGTEVSEDTRLRYELFIGGWLHYYDSEVMNGDIDHAISFDWLSVPNSVVVSISPRYKEKSTNLYLHIPPPGAGDPPTPKHPPPY